MTVEIRALRKEDDRAAFTSDDEALDLYFHRFAGQNQFRHHVGVTYVAVDEGLILGFVTVAGGSMDACVVAGKKMPPYPLPILRVARLAVATLARGRGIGRALVRFCIELAEHVADETGCVGLVVDAKADAVDFYDRLGFHRIDLLEGAVLQRPAPTPMFLPLGSVPPRLAGTPRP